MTPPVPFIDEVITFLVVAFYIIGIILTCSSIQYYHSLPFVFFLPMFMLRSTYFIVYSDSNLSVFVVPLILANAAIKPKSVIRISRCSMAVRNPSVFPILKGRIVESSATWPSTGCAYPSFSPDKPAWR